jgi:hypothetical protein
VEAIEEAREGSRGGICTVAGSRVILVDSGASMPERVAVLADALCREDLEALYLPPALRERLNRSRRGSV